MLRTCRLLGAAVVLAAIVPVASAGASPRSAPVVRTIAVGSNPIELAISAKLGEAFVANDGSVSTVDLRTHTQTSEIGTGVVSDQTAIGLGANDKRAYIGVFDRNQVVVMNTVKQTIVGQVTVGFGADSITSDGNGFVYVSLITAKRVAVIQTSDNTVAKQIPLAQSPQTATLTPSGNAMWVGSANSGMIWGINTATQTVTRRLNAVRSGPVVSIAFTSDNTQAWVSGLGGVSVIARSTGKLLAFLPITHIFPDDPAPNAGPIALNPANTQALVVNSTFPDAPAIGTVAVVDTATLAIGKQIQLGTEPIGMALDTKRGKTYVANYQDDTLSYFNTPK